MAVRNTLSPNITVGKILILLWAILSVWAVIVIGKQYLNGQVYKLGIRDGKTFAIVEIIDRTEQSCEPVRLYTKEKEVNLIRVDCQNEQNQQVSADESQSDKSATTEKQTDKKTE